MEVTPGARNVNEYVRIVRDQEPARSWRMRAARFSRTPSKPTAKPPALPSWRSSAFTASGRDVKLRACHGFLRLSPICIPNWTSVPGRTVKFPGMSTGFHALDTALTGLNKSDLILIAARPGMGKTAFALNVALNAAKASVKNKERRQTKRAPACACSSLRWARNSWPAVFCRVRHSSSRRS